MTPYQQLEARFRELSHLGHAQSMLSWDDASMMPAGGGEARGEALATIAGVVHQMLTDPRLAGLLDQAESSLGRMDAWQQANLRQMRRAQRRAIAVPESLVRAKQIVSARCEQTWRVARPENDWESVRDLLREVVQLARDEAAALGEQLGLEPYDALLDGYEAETRTAEVASVFDDLKTFLPDFLERVLARQVEPLPLKGPFAPERQRALGEVMMEALGFDFHHGRLDVSHHPFCGGVPDDTRITTRFNDADFLESLLAVLHETGHALYQQGLPREWRHQPVGSSLGMAVHESQSLLLEMQVSRSRAFMEFAAPIIRKHLGPDRRSSVWGASNLHALATRVQPGYIRVDADEVTYPLHIIVRFELEQRLMNGELAVADVPEAWNEFMTRYLGLSTSGNFKDGCMQDVHWYAGLLGYFPTYTLGALTAAQWFDAASRANPELEEEIRRGDFAPLIGWLRAQIHGRGQLLSARELLLEVSGEPLNARFFKTHLERRYLSD